MEPVKGETVSLQTPGEFFRSQVASVAARHNIILPETIEFYLVTLLSEFVTFDGSANQDRFAAPLVVLLAEATELGPKERVRQLRGVGDLSLYVSGYFPEFFSSKPYGSRYYVTIGQQAYLWAAELTRHMAGEPTAVYLELAQGFTTWVRVLSRLAETLRGQASQDLLGLYERWLELGDRTLEERLVEAGILPNAGVPRTPQ